MRRIGSVIARSGGAALILVGLWTGPPARAAAATLELEYDAFVLGFPALTFDFELDEGAADYHVEGSAHTHGIANMVVNYRLETRTDGRIVDGKPSPTAQISRSRRNGSERLMRLEYQGSTVHAQALPPVGKVLSPTEIAGTFDPASAALVAGHMLAASGRCDQRIKVFDGHTRYDLVLGDEGDTQLDRGLGAYAGPAHRCRLEVVKLHEVPRLPPLPVRIDFTSRWGTASIALTRVRPAAAVARVRP